jgi:hypothetical protein
MHFSVAGSGISAPAKSLASTEIKSYAVEQPTRANSYLQTIRNICRALSKMFKNCAQLGAWCKT